MSKQTASTTHDDDSGSFGLGLVLGAIAGAGAMFLFKTEKGAKMRASLEEEWQDARAHLLTKGEEGAYDAPATLREAVAEGYAVIRDAILKTGLDSLREQSGVSSSSPSAENDKKPTKPKKFKGV